MLLPLVPRLEGSQTAQVILIIILADNIKSPYFDPMFTNSYIQVSHLFTVIVLVAESTLKLKNDTGSKIFRNPNFEVKVRT